MPQPTAKELDQMYSKLPLVTEPPTEAWIRMADFAGIARCSVQSVKAAFFSGQFSHEHCCVMPMKSGGKRLLLNWNELGFNFIAHRAKKFWPQDFKPKSKKYRPFKVTKEITKVRSSAKAKKALAATLPIMDNIHDAKFEIEKRKLQQLDVEIKIANNEVLAVDKVAETAQGIAYAVKSQLRRFVVLASPKLLGIKTVQDVRTILEDNLQDTLGDLESLLVDTTFTGEKK